MGMTATAEESAFNGFVETHSGSLRHTAFLLTGSHDVAEDLLQDALVKTWLAWKRIDPRTAWAYTRRIMVNLTTDRWRRKRYEAITLDIDDRRADPGAQSSFDAVDHRFDIVAQLAALAPRERAIVVLRYYDDLSESDIAAHLGVSVGTVKSTCSRALAKLRSRSEAAQATRSLT